jgi:cholesterol oxidase
LAANYQVIVVGSGFGGAVTACRLAEAGHSVLVLERGRRWKLEDYPRQPGDAWLYDNDCPQECNGWLEFRFFRNMVVAAAAGVGGGSLAYANVSAIPPADNFISGWPAEISFAELQPHFDTVGQMLNVQVLPDNQLTQRFALVKEAAQAIGDETRFRKLPLAVSFDRRWNYELKDPFSGEHSYRFVNSHGIEQGSCVHSGECNLGCRYQAKNTLDLNYLAVAEHHGTEIRPLHQVSYLEPDPAGYRVHFETTDLESGSRSSDSEVARRVVLSAGSIGSTEILLRSAQIAKTLPDLSTTLGQRWSSNGDFLTPANHPQRQISPTHGPTITCGIDYLDGEKHGQNRYVVEDGGVPPLLRSAIGEILPGRVELLRNPRRHALTQGLRRYLEGDNEMQHFMPWFANGQDAADGHLYFGRPWYAPWRKQLKMRWDVHKSKMLIDRIIARHQQLAEATGGKAKAPFFWRLFHNLITPHPLGGCNMGPDRQHGVVDHRGRVFDHPGLYVIDGAMIPEAIGINPSRTIAAVAERSAALLVDEISNSPSPPS